MRHEPVVHGRGATAVRWRSASRKAKRVFGAGRALALGLALTTCAPQVQAPGPLGGSPALEGLHLVAGDGRVLAYRVWHPRAGSPEPRAVIIALHGFNDYGNAFAAPATWWAEGGITTYAYDQRGFGATGEPGLWPGIVALVEDLRAFTAFVHRRHPATPLYLLGHSMGGAVIMVAMAADPAPRGVAGVVLVAPAVWGRATMNPLYRAALWLGAHVAPWNLVSARGLGITPSDNTDMLRALGRDPLVIKETRIDSTYGLVNLMDAALAEAPRLAHPALILYGANDEIIRRKPTAMMLRRVAGRHRTAHYPDGYHMLLRDLQAEVVWRDILAWINDVGAPLPSGGEFDGGVLPGDRR